MCVSQLSLGVDNNKCEYYYDTGFLLVYSKCLSEEIKGGGGGGVGTGVLGGEAADVKSVAALFNLGTKPLKRYLGLSTK